MTKLTIDANGWLSELAADHAADLRIYLSRFSSNPADLDDWIQEAFLRCCAASKSQELHEPRAYLFRTARNLAFSKLKHRKIRRDARHVLDLTARQRTEHPPLHRIAQTDQDVSQLRQAIESLPKRCREAFVLCKLHGFTHLEIADILNISISTVEKHLVKGLRLCRAHMIKEVQTTTEREMEQTQSGPSLVQSATGAKN